MAKKITTKRIGNDFVLYDREKDAVHFANASAEIVYTMAQKGANIEEIKEAIQEEFTLEGNEDLASDIQKCLAELEQKGLLGERKK